MKPFNLKAAIAGEPVVNSKGQKAYYRFTLGRRTRPKAAGYVFEIENSAANFAYVFDDCGIPMGSDSSCTSELFMASVKKTWYQNVYKAPFGVWSGGLHDSLEGAESAKMTNEYLGYTFVKTVTFEIEE
jgi:hypothetical protein